MRGFIEELRYRNVFRVGVAYIVAAWLIAQVADLGADVFNAPDWFMQMLVVLLLLGLPVALFLSWAYELTPDGMKKADELPPDMPKDPRAGRVLNTIIIVTLTIAVAWLSWDRIRDGGSGDSESPTDDRSIAVLPFDDFSPDGDHAWFADGLAEEILNSLARTADLQVASRTSSFAYRDSNLEIPDIAAQLGVAHVLEGSVRRAGDRLRVTAQLIRAADDKHLWSETFDGTNADSIDFQERMAVAIANQLQTAMDPEELARMVSAGTRSVEAWELYLRGLAEDQRVSDEMDATGVYDAIALFEQAVMIDPQFADAHLMLADLWQSQINLTHSQFIPSDISYEQRLERFRNAVEAAARYARSDMSRVEAEMRMANQDVDYVEQIRLAERMTEIDPDRRQGWAWLQYLTLSIGDYERSREAGLRAWTVEEEVGSADSVIFQSMHRASMPDALRMVDETLNAPNPSINELYQSHRVLLAAGQLERAAQIAARYVAKSGDFEGKIMVQVRQACAEGRVADADRLFETVDPGSNTRWLFLETLGREDEARELLMPFDTPEGLYLLSNFLNYPNFEARDYPLLWKKLTDQGINRPPARPLDYRCSR